MPAKRLRVILLKPSKYSVHHGYVERFRRGFMPNSTVPYMRSLTPSSLDGVEIETHVIDEYVRTDLDYLKLLRRTDCPTLLALIGVQSHQFHRSLDLAALARENGVEHCVIGGPHPMTCDTSMLQNKGVSFALAEAELIWLPILRDAIRGELEPVYGQNQRWAQRIDAPVLIPPSPRELKRFVVPMMGVYPARGCPFTCSYCSVIKISGRKIRSQSIDTTMATLRAAKAAGVKLVMFTSDNFNKYPDAAELLERMIAERIRLRFFVQCDTQVAKQEGFIELLGRARCYQMFIGAESFSRKTLLAAHKAQNRPESYDAIVRRCRKHGIETHFSNIIGFPGDGFGSVREHVETLCELSPDQASFYVLTPIPGTQQYDEFQAAGLINEPNLDRFDTTMSCWRHDALSREQLDDLLFWCYRRFYTARRILKSAIDCLRPARNSPGLISGLGQPVFGRYSAWKRVHPMSGGIGRVFLDNAADYSWLRRKRYGFHFVPLPQSLSLSPTDEAINRSAKLPVHRAESIPA